jgi:hypothetical protein
MTWRPAVAPFMSIGAGAFFDSCASVNIPPYCNRPIWPNRSRRELIRIEITAAAYAALAAGRDPNSLIEAQGSPSGGFYLWLDKVTLNKLSRARGPGESYSDMILRWANEEEAA